MHKDVLYLMVVNLPTEEEVQGSVARLEQMIRERDSGALGYCIGLKVLKDRDSSLVIHSCSFTANLLVRKKLFV